MSLDLDIDHLKNRMAQLVDDELLKIAFTNSHEYQPAAVEIAKEEMRRRGRSIEMVVTDPTNAVVALQNRSRKKCPNCGYNFPEEPYLLQEIDGVPRKRWYQLFGI